MESLATKYRPRTFDDVVCQDNIKKVLENQLSNNEVKQGYLFCGGAGTGKTTSARIFANVVNEGKGKPIEIDGASNNGVDNIREIINDCVMKSLDSKYKIYIIDECHMLSTGAWNAFLKVLEEPPKGVIFILCTTDPHKIPNTILSRVQRFNFKKIPTPDIVKRLEYIIATENRGTVVDGCGSADAVADERCAEHEGFTIISFQQEALEYIAKLADGGMRDAITKLDTVLGYTNNITLESTLQCLGITNYNNLLLIVKGMINRDAKTPIEIINQIHRDGKDLKLFVKDLAQFILDLNKIYLTNDFDLTNIPQDITRECTTLVNKIDIDTLVFLLDSVEKLLYKIKYESNPKSVIESELILICLK